MRRKRLKTVLLTLFFTVHLSLVFFQGIWTTIDGYRSVHFDGKPLGIPVLSLFRQNSYTEPYYMLSGINTGYGFYGIKTSTEKYFRATYLDTADNVLKADRYFGLSTMNGISRMGSFASFLVNYIADTERMEKQDSTSAEEIQKRIKFRKDYVTKSMKWLGKETANAIPGCASYRIELMTLVPVDAQQKNKTKPELYVVQEGLFRAE